MDQTLKAFLQGRTPLAEDQQDWSGGGRELVQTRFTYALQAQQPGDIVPIAVMRGDERIEADVTLEARQ